MLSPKNQSQATAKKKKKKNSKIVKNDDSLSTSCLVSPRVSGLVEPFFFPSPSMGSKKVNDNPNAEYVALQCKFYYLPVYRPTTTSDAVSKLFILLSVGCHRETSTCTWKHKLFHSSALNIGISLSILWDKVWKYSN